MSSCERSDVPDRSKPSTGGKIIDIHNLKRPLQYSLVLSEAVLILKSICIVNSYFVGCFRQEYAMAPKTFSVLAESLRTAM